MWTNWKLVWVSMLNAFWSEHLHVDILKNVCTMFTSPPAALVPSKLYENDHTLYFLFYQSLGDTPYTECTWEIKCTRIHLLSTCIIKHSIWQTWRILALYCQCMNAALYIYALPEHNSCQQWLDLCFDFCLVSATHAVEIRGFVHLHLVTIIIAVAVVAVLVSPCCNGAR